MGRLLRYGERTTTVTVRMPVTLVLWLEAQAIQIGLSRSELIVALLTRVKQEENGEKRNLEITKRTGNMESD
jgi:hypothetical protein